MLIIYGIYFLQDTIVYHQMLCCGLDFLQLPILHKDICEHILDCDYLFNILHSQKPIGLISLLDEESNFPNGSDLTFANKLKQHLSDNPCFKEERGGAFSVRHYAGEVS